MECGNDCADNVIDMHTAENLCGHIDPMCFAIFACSFNLLLGFAGLLSFGHAAFFATGGYITGYLLSEYSGLGTELGILAGTLASTLLGLGFGLLAIRRQGIYFAMITLALAQMVYFFSLQAPFTGGEDGIQSVPRGALFGVIDLNTPMAMYMLVLVIFLAGFLFVWRVVHSPFGQVLKAIRENEPRAISLGYDTNRFKLLAFVLSAALAGLAGSLKTLVLGFATLSDAHWTASGHVVLMTLVGGLGTLSGPIVGSAVVVLLENKLGEIGSFLASVTGVEWFNTLGESVTMVTGLIFVICVLAFRRGIMGEIIEWLARRRAANASA